MQSWRASGYCKTANPATLSRWWYTWCHKRLYFKALNRYNNQRYQNLNLICARDSRRWLLIKTIYAMKWTVCHLLEAHLQLSLERLVVRSVLWEWEFGRCWIRKRAEAVEKEIGAESVRPEVRAGRYRVEDHTARGSRELQTSACWQRFLTRRTVEGRHWKGSRSVIQTFSARPACLFQFGVLCPRSYNDPLSWFTCSVS